MVYFDAPNGFAYLSGNTTNSLNVLSKVSTDTIELSFCETEYQKD